MNGFDDVFVFDERKFVCLELFAGHARADADAFANLDVKTENIVVILFDPLLFETTP